jgi:hypothetical protein
MIESGRDIQVVLPTTGKLPLNRNINFTAKTGTHVLSGYRVY